MPFGFLRSPLALSLLAVTLIYWGIAPFFEARHAIEFVDGIVISCSGTVFVVYGRRFLSSLKSDTPDVFDMIISGIAGGWFINHIDRFWRMMARVFDAPYMIDHLIVGYLLAMMALFACYHLIVRGVATNGEAPTRRHPITLEAWGVITTAIVCGAALGTLAVVVDLAVRGAL